MCQVIELIINMLFNKRYVFMTGRVAHYIPAFIDRTKEVWILQRHDAVAVFLEDQTDKVQQCFLQWRLSNNVLMFLFEPLQHEQRCIST